MKSSFKYIGIFSLIFLCVACGVVMARSGEPSILDGYPKELIMLELDEDEILDIKDHAPNNSIEIYCASRKKLSNLVEHFTDRLSVAEDLAVFDSQSNYMISATTEGVSYTVMLSEGTYDANPEHRGKVGVFINIIGLKDYFVKTIELPEGESQAWPAADMPGVPRLQGFISGIGREDNGVWFRVVVDSIEVVEDYVGQLSAAGFRFDSEPTLKDGYIEFYAFRDDSILNFSYKASEQRVSVEYLR